MLAFVSTLSRSRAPHPRAFHLVAVSALLALTATSIRPSTVHAQDPPAPDLDPASTPIADDPSGVAEPIPSPEPSTSGPIVEEPLDPSAEPIADAIATPDATTCLTLAPGCYRDADGQLRDARLAYRTMRPHVEGHPWHALAWNGGFLAGGTAWYWIDRKQNSVDWDSNGWRSRFTFSALRFDNNQFPMNFVFHPMAGSSFYGVARSNDLGILASAAYAVGTSFGWEFGIEFREKFSINDILMTGNSGIVLGEFFYKLGRYFNSAPGGGGRRQRALAWSAGFPVALHDWMHHRAHVDSSLARDNLGFSADIWHRFRMSSGFVALNPSQGTHFEAAELHLAGELVTIPGYLREGEFHRTFADADRTRMRLRSLFGGGGPSWEIESDVVLAGYYRQRLRASPHGLRGHATMVGLDLGYVYRNQAIRHWTDNWSSLHLPGIALEHHYVAGPVTIRVGAEANVDFTGAYAVGLPQWNAENPGEHGKDILRSASYYYGWGFSTRARLDVTMPFVELGLHLDYAYVNSREGLSRTQELVERDQKLHDTLLDVETTLRLIPWNGLFVEASVLRQHRQSFIDTIENNRHLVRTAISIGIIR